MSDMETYSGPWEVTQPLYEDANSSGKHSFYLLFGKSFSSTKKPLSSTAFAAGHCYEPFVKYGNLTSSDNAWAVGAVVEFACDPGYTLEQGSVTIECMDPNNPQWNETEPACRGLYVWTNLHLFPTCF